MNKKSLTPEPVNVVYAANDNYAFLAGVSLTSLLENNRQVGDLRLYILTDGMSQDNVRRLRQLAASYGRQLQAVDIREKLATLSAQGVNGYDNAVDKGLTTYSRLLLGELLPDLSRCLYLDCDTMVNGSIADLYSLDLGGKPLALAYDCTHNRYKQVIGLAPTAKYYNAGVMLVDLEAWRAQRCWARLAEHIRTVRSQYPLVDQDLLNVVLGDNCALLPMAGNYLSAYFLYDQPGNMCVYGRPAPPPTSFWLPEQWLPAARAPAELVIAHFAGATFGRPWYANSRHPLKAAYDHYYQLSPWRDRPQETFTWQSPYAWQYWLWRWTPRWLAVAAGQLMQRAFMLLFYHV